MNEIPLSALYSVLAALVLISSFFSASETALMSLNRYRLRHLAKQGNRGAQLAQRLLKQPDRLIGLILIGNNLANMSAASLTTLVALRLMGDSGVAVGTGLVTLVLLIFAEIAPKTYAARHPERIAFPAAYLYVPMLKVSYPLVWLVSLLANGFLRLLGLSKTNQGEEALSREELRTLVNETNSMLPKGHQKMLLNILDLEQITVEDIMVPRNDIDAIDLNDDWDDILDQISTSSHGRLPVYREDISQLSGVLHIRNIIKAVTYEDLDREQLESRIQEPYFIPEGTALTRQLLNFQKHKQRIGLVVDEYGDIQGLVTLEDILKEIVGEFSSAGSSTSRDIHPQEDGTVIADGSAHLRDLNRSMHWQLPTDGPKTLNGFILEYLESIPEPGTTFLLENHPVEIMQTKANAVKSVKIYPQINDRQISKQVSATPDSD